MPETLSMYTEKVWLGHNALWASASVSSLHVTKRGMQCLHRSLSEGPLTCRTSEAFKRRLGVVGLDEQAERMLTAFVDRGLELRTDEIKYHAQGERGEIDKLTGVSAASTDAEVGVQIVTHS